MTCQRVVQPDQLAAPCFVAACPVAVADGAQSGDLGFRLQSAQRVGEVHRGLEGDGAVTVTAPAVLNGRHAEPGGLFVAFAAEQVDGHDYAGQARGGRTGLPAHSAATVVVQDAQAALQALPTDVVGRLRDGLTIIGLTGCQGKTSVQQLAHRQSNVGPAVKQRL